MVELGWLFIEDVKFCHPDRRGRTSNTKLKTRHTIVKGEINAQRLAMPLSGSSAALRQSMAGFHFERTSRARNLKAGFIIGALAGCVTSNVELNRG